jgi:hypothetical protein
MTIKLVNTKETALHNMALCIQLPHNYQRRWKETGRIMLHFTLRGIWYHNSGFKRAQIFALKCKYRREIFNLIATTRHSLFQNQVLGLCVRLK